MVCRTKRFHPHCGKLISGALGVNYGYKVTFGVLFSQLLYISVIKSVQKGILWLFDTGSSELKLSYDTVTYISLSLILMIFTCSVVDDDINVVVMMILCRK